MNEQERVSFNKRKARLLSLLNDPDLNLTLLEKITYAWHWGRCEYHHQKGKRAHKNFHKHAKKLVDIEKVYRLRKNMKDL